MSSSTAFFFDLGLPSKPGDFNPILGDPGVVLRSGAIDKLAIDTALGSGPILGLPVALLIGARGDNGDITELTSGELGTIGGASPLGDAVTSLSGSSCLLDPLARFKNVLLFLVKPLSMPLVRPVACGSSTALLSSIGVREFRGAKVGGAIEGAGTTPLTSDGPLNVCRPFNELVPTCCGASRPDCAGIAGAGPPFVAETLCPCLCGADKTIPVPYTFPSGICACGRGSRCDSSFSTAS